MKIWAKWQSSYLSYTKKSVSEWRNNGWWLWLFTRTVATSKFILCCSLFTLNTSESSVSNSHLRIMQISPSKDDNKDDEQPPFGSDDALMRFALFWQGTHCSQSVRRTVTIRSSVPTSWSEIYRFAFCWNQKNLNNERANNNKNIYLLQFNILIRNWIGYAALLFVKLSINSRYIWCFCRVTLRETPTESVPRSRQNGFNRFGYVPCCRVHPPHLAHPPSANASRRLSRSAKSAFEGRPRFLGGSVSRAQVIIGSRAIQIAM